VKFQINRDVLAEAVSFAVKLLPRNSNLPILDGVLIEATADGLVFSSFDYTVSTTSLVAATIEEPGKILVLGRLLADIASRLPNAPVTISTDDSRVLVKCGSSEFTLLSMSIDEYPTVPRVTGETGVVKAEDFADAVSQVALAASREDVTPVIQGVLLEVSGNTLNMVATDRYRVAIKSLDWDSSESAEFSALIPARTISEIGKTFAGAGTISISLTQVDDRELIAFTADNRTVTSLLIKGTFPPVKKLFPEEVPQYAVVNTADLVEATRRVKLVVDRDGFMKFTFANNSVSLESVSGEQAQGHETVDAVLNVTEVVLSLKADYLLDGLGAVHSEFTRIGFISGETSTKPGPVLLTSQTSRDAESNDGFRYLLQPKLLLR
jgi:DNA polymerase-3 subunit beta